MKSVRPINIATVGSSIAISNRALLLMNIESFSLHFSAFRAKSGIAERLYMFITIYSCPVKTRVTAER